MVASATILALVLGMLVLAAPAAAKEKQACGRAVINDWFGDWRVDQIYALHCYRDAIKSLPVDVRDYSSAKEDILRALLSAQQGKSDPGDAGAAPTRGGPGSAGGSGSGGSGSGSGSTGGGTSAAGSPGVVDTSGPSSVPIPLVILAGLATLLLALGAAGYLTRRMAARRAGDDHDETA
jgi:uncharacterized membrane protein YgcG